MSDLVHYEWLNAATFAAEAGISRRGASKALARAFAGKPWRGHALVVRMVSSRGGAAGAAYEVRADSLPGRAAPALPAVPDAPAPALPRHGAVIADRLEAIGPVLPLPHGSPERGMAAAEAARQAGVSKDTIYRWISAYEAEGMTGLGRKVRADRDKRTYAVTRAWDRAVTFDAETKARIGAEIRRYIRSLWGNNVKIGRTIVGRMAEGRLRELTTEAGFEGGAVQLKAACRLPTRVIMRDRLQFRTVAIHDHDRKQWEDKHAPRIQRSRAAVRPMELVVSDVHHTNVLLPRPDGSTFTPKLVAFEDYATARLFVFAVFLKKGEGVRQEHFAAGFAAMSQHPEWGLPEVLYIDNGKELAPADMMADAMQLNTRFRDLADDAELAEEYRRDRAVIRAKPYNAAAKSIEGGFSRLDGFLSFLPGWIGDDRMNKKTANVGREPVPYPHGETAFLGDVENAVAAYNSKPQSGMLAGRSPQESYGAAVANGWRRRPIELAAVLAAFARDKSRVVRQGAFTYEGRRYTAPAVHALPAGTELLLRVPIFGDVDVIPVIGEDRGLLCLAAADTLYHPFDSTGAADRAGRVAAAHAAVAETAADMDRLDMREELARLAAAGKQSDSLEPVRATKTAEAIGHAMLRTPAERDAAELEDNEISRKRTREARARYLEKVRAAG